MGVVLPFYSSRVDFTNEKLYPAGVEFGLLLPDDVAPTVSFAGLCVAVPLAWRRVLSFAIRVPIAILMQMQWRLVGPTKSASGEV